MSENRYLSPKQTGGTLIRKVLAQLKSYNLKHPITSHILIGSSAGLDSTALAHLLVNYGRRVATKSSISLLHVNHGWRGKESDADQAKVQELGESLGVLVHAVKLEPGSTQKPDASWEEQARAARVQIFETYARRLDAIIMTAHHADDLVETLLWRLFTGQFQTHGAGIWGIQGNRVRPLLTVRKSELENYLQEEGITWRNDSTNQELRFMRARMRETLMPQVQALFPQAHAHLVELALSFQRQDSTSPPPVGSLFLAAGIKDRRNHWREVGKIIDTPSLNGPRGIDLPGSWRLIHEPKSRERPERWVLEKRD